MNSTVNYTVVVDKLRMLCSGKIPILESMMEIVPLDKHIINEQIILQRNYTLLHPGFLHGFNILLNNKILGYLSYGNTGEYRYTVKDTSQLTIENHILYQSGWLQDLQLVLETLGLHFYKYSFMEIAVDGLDLIGRFTKLNYDKRLQRKRHVLVRPLHDSRQQTNISYIIGSAKSEKHLTLYNKTEELKESNKQYISEFWNRNGLSDLEGNIHRCEVRLKAKALKSFSGDLMHLDDPAYLASYFKSAVGGYLEFFDKKQTKKRHFLINWSKFNEVKLTKNKLTHKAFKINRYKSMLRYLFEEYVVTNDELYLTTFASITIQYKLFNWVRKVISRWIREFRLIN